MSFVGINNGEIVCGLAKKKKEKLVFVDKITFTVRLVGLPSGRGNIYITVSMS